MLHGCSRNNSHVNFHPQRHGFPVPRVAWLTPIRRKANTGVVSVDPAKCCDALGVSGKVPYASEEFAL